MYDAERVRELNDQFRKSLRGGKVVCTQGIMALPGMVAILERVREFNNFTEDNDPHHEHDFGAFTHGGQNIFFKIDYYDLDLNQGSEDPSDINVTKRVMTILLASEY